MEKRNFEITISQLINKGLETLVKKEETKDVIKNMFNAYKINNEDLITIYQDTLGGLIAEAVYNTKEIVEFWRDYIKDKDPKDIPVRLDIEGVIAKHSFTNGVQTINMSLDLIYLNMVGDLQAYTEWMGNYNKIPFYKEDHSESKYYIGVDESNIDVFSYLQDEETETEEGDGWDD